MIAERTLRARSLFIAVFFAGWFLAVMLFNAFLAGPGREKHLEAGRRIAQVSGSFYLPRARLLDRNGVPLAWSEKYFDLVWEAQLPPPSRLFETLAEILPGLDRPKSGDGGYELKRNLRPMELVRLDPLIRRHPELKIRPRLRRVAVSDPELRQRLGQVEYDGHRQLGISGFEAQFDDLLTGAPGNYEVMLDRYRNWIDDTWRITREPAAGADVFLDFSIAETTTP